MPSRNASALENFRHYLVLLARMQLGEQYRGKLDPSDVVQQVMLEAVRSQERYCGSSDREMAGWLRGILGNILCKSIRDLHRDKRDVLREKPLQDQLEQSSARLEAWLIADQSSPSGKAGAQEQVLRLAGALATLPERQREAIVLRHCQGLAVVDIARKLDCTSPTVIGLLKRGIEHVREALNRGSEE